MLKFGYSIFGTKVIDMSLERDITKVAYQIMHMIAVDCKKDNDV